MNDSLSSRFGTHSESCPRLREITGCDVIEVYNVDGEHSVYTNEAPAVTLAFPDINTATGMARVLTEVRKRVPAATAGFARKTGLREEMGIIKLPCEKYPVLIA